MEVRPVPINFFGCPLQHFRKKKKWSFKNQLLCWFHRAGAVPAKPASVLKFKNTKISFRSYVWSLSLRITLNLWDTKVKYSTSASCITFNSSYIYLKCRVNQQSLTVLVHSTPMSHGRILHLLEPYFFLIDPWSWCKSCWNCTVSHNKIFASVASGPPHPLPVPYFASLCQAGPALWFPIFGNTENQIVDSELRSQLPLRFIKLQL